MVITTSRFQTQQRQKLPSAILGAEARHELATEYSILARYLGETRFEGAVHDFLHATQARKGVGTRAKSFPDYLAVKFQAFPEIGELAVFECSLHNAEKSATRTGSTSVLEHEKTLKTSQLHFSAQLLAFSQNTTSIWACLVCGEPPPRPYTLDLPQHVVVWRQVQRARFRLLGTEEARDLAAFKRQPSGTSPYFLGWLETGLAVALAK